MDFDPHDGISDSGLDRDILALGAAALGSLAPLSRAHAGDDVLACAGDLAASQREAGVARWMGAIRRHHDETHRHCLFVTGLAVAFGRTLGFSGADVDRLALGGLLHDIGKAAVPRALLAKPTPLDEAEAAIMRGHAALGRDMIVAHGGFDTDMVDIVAHHHELLDGTGYPDGLMGHRIGELVRIVTIVDIFAALVERRAYKPALSAPEAYAYLVAQGDKLDRAFVRAFEAVAIEAGRRAA